MTHMSLVFKGNYYDKADQQEKKGDIYAAHGYFSISNSTKHTKKGFK